jgi:tetratricopeptide (TPR) repeat protein
MELLRGEPLDSRLRAGALSVSELLTVAIQIAGALEAAHERGILHRDITPANIFVTVDGQAKILDFGLGKLVNDRAANDVSSSSPTHSRSSGIVPENEVVPSGSVSRYGSPEQLRGEPVDGRTDLYSFGLVMYEMATGEPAFAPGDPAAVFEAVQNRVPPSPRTLKPDLPAALETIIEKAIEKDRALRYQHAADLITDLRRVKRSIDSTLSDAVPLPRTVRQPAAGRLRDSGVRRRPRRMSRISSLALAAAAILVLAVLLWQRWPPGRRATPLTERDSVLLATIANKTADPVFDDTLRQALAVQLSQSPFLDIVPQERVRETLQLMGRLPDVALTREIGREVCERLGVKAMLEGAVATVGEVYVVTLTATDCRSGEAIAQEQIQAKAKEGVLSAVGDVASTMRARLGESLATRQKYNVRIEVATTPSLEALKAYTIGVQRRETGVEIEAIPFFERAIELDPKFALAYTTLSSLYGSLGETDRGEQYARLAYENREHVSERERLFIVYQYHDRVTGDQMLAAKTLGVWKESYPRDYRAPNALSVIFARLGQFDRAIEEGREAMRRNPSHPFPYSNLAHAYRGANRFAEAKQTAEQAVSRKFETLPTRRLLYQIAVMDGDTEAARRHLEWGIGRSREFDLTGAEAQVAAFKGRLSRARDLYDRTEAMARSHELPQVAAGYDAQAIWTELLYGNVARAAADARALVAAKPTHVPLLRAAAALALAGDAAEAERIVTASKARGSTDTMLASVYAPMADSAIELARHNPQRAIEKLQPTEPYELGFVAALVPLHLRGRALLDLGRGADAAAEFRRILAHRGTEPFSPVYALARVGLARALRLSGDTAGGRAAYAEFLADWADADTDIPVLKEVKREYEQGI